MLLRQVLSSPVHCFSVFVSFPLLCGVWPCFELTFEAGFTEITSANFDSMRAVCGSWRPAHSLFAIFLYSDLSNPRVGRTVCLKLPRSDGQNEIFPLRGGLSPSPRSCQGAAETRLYVDHEHWSSTGTRFTAIPLLYPYVPSLTLLMDMHSPGVFRTHSLTHRLPWAGHVRSEVRCARPPPRHHWCDA